MRDNEKNVLLEAPIKTKEEIEQLNEVKMSWAGKLFFAAIAAFILGKTMEKINIPIKIRGNPEQMKALVDAIVSSKKFQDELARPGATVESVIEKLNIRNMTKERYKAITNKPWPL